MDVAPALCYLLFERQRIRLFGIGLSGWSMATAISLIRDHPATFNLLHVDWVQAGIGFVTEALHDVESAMIWDNSIANLLSPDSENVLLLATEPCGLLRRNDQNCHRVSGCGVVELKIIPIHPHSALRAFDSRDAFQPICKWRI